MTTSAISTSTGFDEAVIYPYDTYEIYVCYLGDTGNRLVPIADSNPGADFVTLSGAYSFKLVEFSITRRGRMPQLPALEKDQNLTLLTWAICPMSPQPLTPGRSNTYAVAGYYLYGHKNPVTPASNLPLGSIPLFGNNPETLPGTNRAATF
jgi:hypothetical protein